MARLLTKYKDEVKQELLKEANYQNIMDVPHLEKITVNIGIGEAVQNPKAVEFAVKDMEVITGQHAMICKAKKSIAGFKLRSGMSIGVMVTLRREKMYEFLDRLVSIVIPRVRDFRGLSPKAFDGYGNYTLGLQEQLVFPEIDYDKIDKVRGLAVTIVTSAKTDDEARLLLAKLGLPFRK